MSNEKRIDSLKTTYQFVQENWDHLISTTPQERSMLNDDFLVEWWSSYVDSGLVDVYSFTIEPHNLQNYLSADTMNHLVVGSNYHTLSNKINEFCEIEQEFVDAALELTKDEWNDKLTEDPRYYILYQMMKFLKLSEDIKERGVIMPLQFHKHYQGYKAHPGSDKQSSIMLNSNVLEGDVPCFYIHYKEYVDAIEIKDANNIKKIKSAEKFKSLFPFWDHESFVLVGSLIEVDANGIINPDFNQHMLPFAEGMISYLNKNNKNYTFSECYISYLDAVHRKELIFKSDKEIRETLGKIKKLSDHTFMLGEYEFVNQFFNSYDLPLYNNETHKPLWIPKHLISHPTSLIDTNYKIEKHNPQLNRKKLSRESVYRI